MNIKINNESGIVDVNVYLDRWPFRRLPHDQPEKLVEKLRATGIIQAWAASFDGLLHRDISSLNDRVVQACEKTGDGVLLPTGTINPMLPGWPEDMRRCAETHNMKAVRIHPNYHRYSLSEQPFSELLDAAKDYGLLVQLVVKMEDERTQHPLVQIPMVDLDPLSEIMKTRPGMKIMLLNSLRSLRGESLSKLAACDNILFETGMLEGVGGLESIVKTIQLERLFFGSYFPCFYLEANLLKFQESNIGGHATDRICRKNAQLLMEK